MFVSKLRLFRPVMYSRRLFMTKPTYSKFLFNYSRMFIHSRGYNNTVGDLPWDMVVDMSGYIQGCRNCEDFAYVFKLYPELPENFIAYAFHQIGMHNYDRDKHFWDVVLPKVKVRK